MYEQPWQRWPHTLRFKKVGQRYAPVKGGRWSVRLSPFTYTKRRWRAWSNGTASKHNRSFTTHAEAIKWASFVADTYATYSREAADNIVREYKLTQRRG